jgi:hypothetical protein
MNKRFFIILSGLFLAWASISFAQTKPVMEEWRSTIDCGGLKFVVVSQCKASGDPFELNTCLSNQKLTLGDKSVNIPASKLRSQPTTLYATYWYCIEEPQGPVVRLGYASGKGRGSDDEGTEFFDYQLRLIQDEKRTDSLFKNLKKVRKGFVRSIMPGEGG